MRATIHIDDDLYREVKAQAARSGRTGSAVFEDAVRRGMNTAAQRQTHPYAVRPMGRGGLRPGVDLSSNAAITEAMD